jgi:hypothetical protein
LRRALFAALVLCAGCGDTTTVTATRIVTAPAAAPAAMPRCVLLSGLSQYSYDVCDRRTIRFRGKPLDVRRPVGVGPVGGWKGGFVSRDGDTLLMQWSAECEVPYAFFVSTHGGAPRLVTGGLSVVHAPESIADGWTSDGRAIVELPHGVCGGSASVPGIYFIAPSGKRTLVQRLPKPAHA